MVEKAISWFFESLEGERAPRHQPWCRDRSQPDRERGRDALKVDEHLVSLLTPSSFEGEQYRTLSLLLEQKRKAGALTVIAVSSPVPGDGKTTTAINLAGTLAQSSGSRVLLMCADLRKPSLARQLGLEKAGSPGLVDAILNPNLALENVVRRYDRFNLAVCTAGRCTPAAYEVLRSARLGELLQEARRQYDYVILDAPPLVLVPDCRIIGTWVDCFLVVVAAHKTPRKLVEEALNLLDPDKVIGLVFNLDDHPVGGYYGYYYPYGQSSDSRRRGWWSRLVKKVTGFPRINVPSDMK